MKDSRWENADKPRKGRRLLIWLAVFLLAIPVLLYLFEFVVPRYLPSNF